MHLRLTVPEPQNIASAIRYCHCGHKVPGIYHDANCRVGPALLDARRVFQCVDRGDIQPLADRVRHRDTGATASV